MAVSIEYPVSKQCKQRTRRPGPSWSNLTTALVNVPLNFQKLISQLCQYFLLKKCEKVQKLLPIFSTKRFSIFGYKVVKH